MTPRQLLLLGSLVLLAALTLVALGAGLRGPADPSCESIMCGDAVAALVQWSALPVAITGSVFVGMGIARGDAPPENVQEADPPSPPNERAP